GVITKFLRNIIDDKPLIIYGDGEQTRDFVSINDVINAFYCAIRSEKNGTYNIAGGESLSINSLAEIMLDVFEKKLEIIHKEIQKGDIRHSVADVSFAASELGFYATRKLKDELPSIYHE
ncbi:MAG: NAD-dependent epimerase/dehydratase family protein, partial [Nitrosopumilus sp.]